MIPPDTVERILNTARIEDVIADYVNLKRRGVNMIGVCPFHDEKTPSFIVSPTKGIYKCFGCGKAGNVSKFIMEHESIGYYEALRFLANKYNIEIEERQLTPEEIQARQISESLYIINNFVADYFDRELFETNEGRSVGLSYFKERGYLESTIKKWNLGYSNRSYKDLINKAKAGQFSNEVLSQSGLMTRSGSDFFNGRVMFSIHNLSGKIIAFAGRTLSSDKSQPKYINSPETAVYEKRKVLYGMYHAKGSIRKEDECLLVEGYTDVITLSQGGIENVVASSGTALTASQIRLVERFTKNIKVIFDGDNAGIKAALRGMDIILEQGMKVRLVLLPDGEDPDSYLKKVGTDSFKEYLKDEAKDFILFKTDLLLQEAGGDPIQKSRVITDIIQSIARIPQAIDRSNYTSICSQRLDMNEDILAREVQKAYNKQREERFKEKEREKKQKEQKQFENKAIVKTDTQLSPIDNDRFVPLPEEPEPVPIQINELLVLKDEYQERDLVRILIAGGDQYYDESKGITIAHYLIHNVKDSIEDFDNVTYRKIFELAMERLSLQEPIDSSFFTNHSDPDIQKVAIDTLSFPYSLANWESHGVYLQTQPHPEKNYKNDSLQAILRFKLRKAQRLIDQVSIEAKQEGLSEEDQAMNIKILQQLLQEKSDIMKMLNQIVV